MKPIPVDLRGGHGRADRYVRCDASLDVSTRARVETVKRFALYPWNVDTAAPKKAIGSAPRKVGWEQPHSSWRSEPGDGQPRHGYAENLQDGIAENDVVRGRQSGSREAHGKRGPEARAKREYPLPLEHHAHRDPSKAQLVARDMKRRLVDAYVPRRVDGLRLRIEFDFVSTKRNGNGFRRSRGLGQEPSPRSENNRRRSGRDPAMREVLPSAPRAQTESATRPGLVAGRRALVGR